MLPLASARCSPPPQKFLQLMGNPAASHVSHGPGVGWGTRPQGTALLAPLLHLQETRHCPWASSSQAAGRKARVVLEHSA